MRGSALFPARSIVVAITALVAGVGAQVPNWSDATLFRSDARFLVSVNWSGVDSTRLRSQSLEGLEDHSILATFALLLEDAAQLPGADPLLRDASGITLHAAQLGDANVVELWVDGPDPARTESMARAAAAAATQHFLARNELYQVDQLRTPEAGRKVGPSRLRAAAVGVGVGLLAGVVVVALWPQRGSGTGGSVGEAAPSDRE